MILFFIIQWKQDTIFHADCLQWDTLHEMSKPVFLENYEYEYFNMSTAEIFTQSAKR